MREINRINTTHLHRITERGIDEYEREISKNISV